MYFFCTYFDIDYLPRGLALYRSLKNHCREFELWILCMDSSSYELLSKMKMPEIQLIALNDFEKDDNVLLETKKNRTKVEYYFTCTPSLPLYLLNHNNNINLITYIDADLYFFSDIDPIYKEIGYSSIAITEHRFPTKLRKLLKYGKYNVGWLSFRRDYNALSCLKWWRSKCIEWCYDRLEDDRYADQKYLDQWPDLFEGVKILKHKGINTAPWNIENYKLACRHGRIYVNDQPLIVYHFQGIRRIFSNIYDVGLGMYKAKLTEHIRKFIYDPYIKLLIKVKEESILSGATGSISISNSRRTEYSSFLKNIIRKIFKIILNLYHVLLKKNYIIISRKD